MTAESADDVRATLAGLWPPIATPFTPAGDVDHRRLTAFGRMLVAEGARGLAILGTTGEAHSLSVAERHGLIDAIAGEGFAGGALIVGTGSPDVRDAADLSRHAVEIGAAAVLVLPPFYYKPVSDDGLLAFVDQLIRRIGPKLPRVLLYHFPSLAGVGWSIPLIARLLREFPNVVVGIKDSSGDHAHTLRLLETFPGFAVLPGSEGNLLEAIRAGARGFITASGNVNAAELAALVARPAAGDAPSRLAAANTVRLALKERGLFPSVKAAIARKLHDDAWLAMRPPLMPLAAEERAALYADPAIARLFG